MCLTNCNLIIQNLTTVSISIHKFQHQQNTRLDVMYRVDSQDAGVVVRARWAVEVSPVYTLIRDTCPPATLLQLRRHRSR